MRELQREIAGIIAKVAEIPAEEVREDVLLKDLGVDSLGALSVVAALEARYGIQIREEDIGEVRTLRDVLALTVRYAPNLARE